MLPFADQQRVRGELDRLQEHSRCIHGGLTALSSYLTMADEACAGYRPRHFRLEELVSPEHYHALGDRCWLYLPDYALWTIDAIREHYGQPVYLNNWVWGGNKRYRGWRPWECSVGAQWSLHKFGLAWDFVVAGVDSEQVRRDCRDAHGSGPWRYVRRLERGTPHIHIDFAYAVVVGVIEFDG